MLRELLEAKNDSYYAIFKIEKILKHSGIIVSDLLRGNQLKLLVDKGLNLSITPQSLIASTIVEFPEFVMTSGAAIPVTNISDYVYYLLNNDFKDFASKSKLEQSKLAGKFIKYCLAENISEQIKYI